MKRLFLMLLCISLLFSGCGLVHVDIKPMPEETYVFTDPPTQLQTTTPPATVLPPQTDVRTGHQVLMIYMVGSDLESESGLASFDIMEILDSGFNEDTTTVLICTGGASFWWMEGISAEQCSIYEVTGGALSQVCTLPSNNMAQPETLTAFLDYGYTACTADYYSLILWNHGAGAVLGFGLDENHGNDALSLQEMDTAFRNSQLISDGKRFEWVGFDACLMAMAEVANMLSDYANFLIASEETEAGTGWDYTCLGTLSDGAHYGGLAASQEIIRTYQVFQETKLRFIPDYTLSAMDLSKVAPMITTLETLIQVAQADLLAGNYSRIAKLRDQAKTFGKATNTSIYDTVDLYDLCEKLMSAYPNEATALQQAVEELVVCHATNVYGAHGVAVYFPYENKEHASQWLQVYDTTDFSPTYTSFIRNFTDILSGKQLAQWNIAELAPTESNVTPGEYYVQLTTQQVENFSRAKYTIWEAESNRPGSYIYWINSSDVHLSEDGKLSTGFEGKRFFLCDTSGNSLSCCAFESERNDEYVKYVIPIMYTVKTGRYSVEPKGAYIHVRVDEANPEGKILGIYEEYPTNDILFPNRNVVDIPEGTSIYPFMSSYIIIFQEDGSVAPFEDWTLTGWWGIDFCLRGELGVRLETGEPESEYFCLISVTDTQGNTYFTSPIYFNQ